MIDPGDELAAPARIGHGAALVPVATIGANVLTYLLLLSAARLLDPGDYGAVLALLGVLLIGTVAALALQTVAARRAATGADLRGLTRATAIVATTAAAVVLVSAPLLERFLHLRSPLGLVAVAAAVPATALFGTYQGLSQGAQSYGRLATFIALGTGGRAIGGLLGIIVGRDPTWCLTGVAVGTTACVLIAMAALGTPRAEGFTAPLPAATVDDKVRRAQAGASRLLAEVAHAAHAHGAFLALTSLDVLVARHVLTATQAGIFAAGAVLSRAALWLPQSAVLVLFASLTERDRHRHAFVRAALVVLGLGVLTTAVCAGAGRLVVSLVAGAKYHALDSSLWLFAALGSCLALIQLTLLAGLALGDRRRIAVVWLNAAADVVVVLRVAPDTPRATELCLLAVTGACTALCLILAMRTPRPVAPVEPAAAQTSTP